MRDFVLKGIFIDAPIPGELRVREGYAVCENGLCAGIYETLPERYAALPLEDHTGRLIIPGLTDLHLHAPQYSYAGTAMDVELLDWLTRYTYPEESRYADAAYAEKGYRRFVNALTCTATTRACIFATLHTDATLTLMRLMEASGHVSYVGKLAMDRNSPDFYREATAAEGLKETERWLDACDFAHTFPMLTPRFTPSVTDAYMEGLGKLAAERKLPMQSHLDENPDEIAWVRELCPDAPTYADTYARYGLFGGECPTVMAHCIYCDAETRALMKKNGVMIAHCPTSNTNVIAGLAPAADYLREGFRIGLGSDVAGGHTLNLFAVMTEAVQVSKLRSKTVAPGKSLTFAEAFHMATAGGGAFFGNVGLFEPGWDFDAAVLDDSDPENPMTFTPEERLEKYAYTGDGAPLAKFAQGRKIV